MKHKNLIKELTGAGVENITEVMQGDYQALNGQKMLSWSAPSNDQLYHLEASYYDDRWCQFPGDNFWPTSIRKAVAWITDIEPEKNYVLEMLTKFRNELADKFELCDEALRRQVDLTRIGFHFTDDRYQESIKIVDDYIQVTKRFYKLMNQQEAQDRRSK